VLPLILACCARNACSNICLPCLSSDVLYPTVSHRPSLAQHFKPKQSSPTPSHTPPCSESSPSAPPHLPPHQHLHQLPPLQQPLHQPRGNRSVRHRRSSRCPARSPRPRPRSRGRRGSWLRRWGGRGRRIGRRRRFRGGWCAGIPGMRMFRSAVVQWISDGYCKGRGRRRHKRGSRCLIWVARRELMQEDAQADLFTYL
jgi:hypothetical protein